MIDSFETQVAPFRTELLAHCYRMTGALSDAEDALQEAFVRAWRALESFKGNSTLRTWLYRITTNTCLDLLADRRARTMPERHGPPGQTETTDDPPWLEPFPDALLGDRPDDALATREAVRLAFIVSLQVLPPRQRATLILREVVGMSAEETAMTLDTSVAAINSALQRAREALESQPRAKPGPVGKAVAELLGRYLAAWEAGDASQLIALLRSDAIFSMPPLPLWVQGPQPIADLITQLIFSRGALKMVPCRANGSPAFAVYQNDELAAVSVLDLDGDSIAAIHSFLAMGSRIDLTRFL